MDSLRVDTDGRERTETSSRLEQMRTLHLKYLSPDHWTCVYHVRTEGEYRATSRARTVGPPAPLSASCNGLSDARLKDPDCGKDNREETDQYQECPQNVFHGVNARAQERLWRPLERAVKSRPMAFRNASLIRVW